MRMHTSGLVPILTLLAATMVALPEPVSGQEMDANASRVAVAVPTAASTVSFGSASEWRAYAGRLLKEAEALPAGSAETLQKIRTAASIQFSLGDDGLALDLIVNAAEAAVGTGSVALAAHAYLDGAWIASAMKRPNHVNQLAERAVMLTISPLMSETDRLAVLRRVEWTTPGELAAR
jgi:hypothetical protein